MKIDFSTPLLDLKGKPLKEGNNDVTLGAAVASALLTPLADDQNATGESKAKRFKIALKVADGGKQEVAIEDLAEIKRLVGKTLTPLAVGRIYEILEAAK